MPSKKPPKPLTVKPKLQLSDKQDSPSVKTDKDSLYRKLYNRSLPFFVWVIEQEPSPYIFKLHIQAQTLKDLTMSSVRASIEIYLSQEDKVNVQFFPKKK